MKLVQFLQKLSHSQVTLELKNGSVVSGTVISVDATMNVHLKKARLVALRGKNPVSYSTLSVRGSTVRCWILPEGLNLDAMLVMDDGKKNVQKAAAVGALGRGGAGRGRGRGMRPGGGVRGGGGMRSGGGPGRR